LSLQMMNEFQLLTGHRCRRRRHRSSIEGRPATTAVGRFWRDVRTAL
jgi:hypothetical protein